MIEIKKITVKTVYPIRNLVLRKGKPIESCHFIDDEKETTQHFGAIIDNKTIGVVSIFEQSNPIFLEKKQFQIRGMAVLEEFQKKGFGNLLIKKSEVYCLHYGADLIWFNARENAKLFYEKLDYIAIECPFEIKDIGLHYIMYKKL